MWGRRGWTDRQGAPESIRPASPGTPWRQPLELQAQLGALGSANPAASGTGPWAARARRAWSGDWHPACRPRVFGAQSQCSCLGTGGFAGLSGPPTTIGSWRNTAVRSQQLQGRLRSVWAHIWAFPVPSLRAARVSQLTTTRSSRWPGEWPGRG